MTYKIKNINVHSNGSVFFSYTSSNNTKVWHFLEKDNKNFILNIKNSNIQSKSESFSKYKNKYFKIK
jgi:hypothetical protein